MYRNGLVFSPLLDDLGYTRSGFCNGPHGRKTNVALAYKGVSVQTGPTGCGRVIEVDQGCQGLGLFQGGKRVVARNKDVAGIHTNTETRVIEGGDKLDKGRGLT